MHLAGSRNVIYVAVVVLIVFGCVALNFAGWSPLRIGILAIVLFGALNLSFVHKWNRAKNPERSGNWQKQIPWIIIGVIAWGGLIHRLLKLSHKL